MTHWKKIIVIHLRCCLLWLMNYADISVVHDYHFDTDIVVLSQMFLFYERKCSCHFDWHVFTLYLHRWPWMLVCVAVDANIYVLVRVIYIFGTTIFMLIFLAQLILKCTCPSLFLSCNQRLLFSEKVKQYFWKRVYMHIRTLHMCTFVDWPCIYFLLMTVMS